MGFSKIHPIKFGFVLNIVNCSIKPQYHVLYDDKFSTADSSTTTYP